jgi:hypothetical protein
MNPEFNAKMSAHTRAIQANWPEYRRIAADGYAENGRGTILVDLGDDSLAGSRGAARPYLNAEQVKERLSDPFSVLIRLDEYNPEREILFTFLDFESMAGQAIILGEREDGVPCGRSFEEMPEGTPPLGDVVPPIVEDRPDTAAATNYDELLDIIHDKVTRSDEDALSADERAIWDILELKYEVQNGGFDQYFFNCGRPRKSVADALRRVGATRISDLFDRACAKVPEGRPPSGGEVVLDLEEILNSDDVWDKDDSEFYQLEEELPEILWRFWTSRTGTSG